jgi:hypothetical protein
MVAYSKQRVKLIVDLTRYNPKCKVGVLGWTMPGVKLSIWDSQDRFAAVHFDNGAELSVLYSGLEVLKEV